MSYVRPPTVVTVNVFCPLAGGVTNIIPAPFAGSRIRLVSFAASVQFNAVVPSPCGLYLQDGAANFSVVTVGRDSDAFDLTIPEPGWILTDAAAFNIFGITTIPAGTPVDVTVSYFVDSTL